MFNACVFVTIFTSSLHAQYFAEISSSLGLELTEAGHFYGDGVSFRDINGDGLDDLTFVRSNSLLTTYLSTGAGFESGPSEVYCPPGALHAVWVDYDNDGYDDLFITVFGGVSRLYRNTGNFEFEDYTAQAGLPLTNDYCYGATFGDYDRDGHLDLYLCRYSPEPAFQTKENVLFKNNGDGTFSDMTELAGVGDGIKASFMGIWVDVNNDMWPDLFVINDRDPANSLYINNTDGTFTNITPNSGTGFPFNDPMSASPADYNNNGLIDIFMSNNGESVNMPPLLLTNNGNMTFTENAGETGISAFTITWGGLWADFDNDGWRDLFYTAAGNVHNYFYINQSGQGFALTEPMTDAPYAPAYTCAKGDFNNDGYADIAVSNLAPTPPDFYANLGGADYYIKVNLTGTVSNREAAGAWLHVYRGSESYHHYTTCGENFISQDAKTVIFGLGDNVTAPDSLVAEYPSGHRDVYYDPAINMTHYLTEGETYTAEILASGSVSLCPGDSVILNAGDHHSYLWNTGDTIQEIIVYDAGEYEVTVTDPFGVSAVASVSVSEFPEPAIAFMDSMPACYGEASGTVVPENESGPEIETIVWDGIEVDSAITSLPAGAYPYEITDANGCTAAGIFTLYQPSEINLLYFVSDEVFGLDGSILITAFGGTPPYQFKINGTETDPLIENLSGGIYTLRAEDANGCIREESATVNSLLSAETATVEKFRFFPNPTSGIAQLSSPQKVRNIVLSDLAGQRLPGHLISGSAVDLSSLPEGVYIAEVVLADGTSLRLKVLRTGR